VLTGYHCEEGNPVPTPCHLGHYCPNNDMSGYGMQPCPRLHYRDTVGAEQVLVLIYYASSLYNNLFNIKQIALNIVNIYNIKQVLFHLQRKAGIM